MEGVAAHAVADDFGQDGRAAPFGEFEFFENQDARAFADDESVAIAVEGPRSVRGIVVALRQARAWPRIRRRPWGDAGLGAAADHDVGIVALDDFEGIADGMGAGGAGRRGGRVRAFGAGANGDVAGGQIDDGGRDEEGRDAARAVLQQVLVLALDDLESADAAADINADALGDFFA